MGRFWLRPSVWRDVSTEGGITEATAIPRTATAMADIVDFSANASADSMMVSTATDSTAANSTVANSPVADFTVADFTVADIVNPRVLKINSVCAYLALLFGL